MPRLFRFFLCCILILLATACVQAERIQAPQTPTPPLATLSSPSTNSTPEILPTVGDFQLNPDIVRRANEGKPLVILVSYHDISNEFALYIRRGVVRSVEDFNATVELIGPVGPDASVQISELERYLEVGVDGLAISPVNSKELTPIINRYLDEGIPVVTFNSDNPESGRLAFAGQDLEESGYQAAHILAQALNGQGDVLVTTLDPAAQWSIARIAGVRRALEEYPEIQLLEIIDTGTEPLEIYNSIETAWQQHSEVAGFLSIECCSTPVVGEFVKRNELATQVKVVGFDELPRTLALIEEGAITASISQDPERQSYEAVRMLIQFITGEADWLTDIDTGITIIDPNNAQEFKTE